MIISLSPLLYHHSLSDLHAGEVIRHTPSLDLSSLFCQRRQTFPSAAVRCFVIIDRAVVSVI